MKKLLGYFWNSILWIRIGINRLLFPSKLPKCPRCGERQDANGHFPAHCWQRCETCKGHNNKTHYCRIQDDFMYPTQWCKDWEAMK